MSLCVCYPYISMQHGFSNIFFAVLKADFQSISSGATPVQDVTRSVSRSAMLMVKIDAYHTV